MPCCSSAFSNKKNVRDHVNHIPPLILSKFINYPTETTPTSSQKKILPSAPSAKCSRNCAAASRHTLPGSCRVRGSLTDWRVPVLANTNIVITLVLPLPPPPRLAAELDVVQPIIFVLPPQTLPSPANFLWNTEGKKSVQPQLLTCCRFWFWAWVGKHHHDKSIILRYGENNVAWRNELP